MSDPPGLQRPDPRELLRERHAPERLIGAVRTVIVSYGVAGLAYLQSRLPVADAPQAAGGAGAAQKLLLIGLGLQLLLIAARALVRRYAPDDASVAKGTAVLGLLADAATVLLFTLGTYTAMARFALDL